MLTLVKLESPRLDFRLTVPDRATLSEKRAAIRHVLDLLEACRIDLNAATEEPVSTDAVDPQVEDSSVGPRA